MTILVDRFHQACSEPLSLTLVAGGGGLGREVTDQRVQKVGLGITGEVDSTHEGRIQVLGETEIDWFGNQPPARQAGIADIFFSRPMACAVVCGALPVPEALRAAAERRRVPLFVSSLPTSGFISETLRQLWHLFAETATIHGVMLEVHGVGVILLGKSGIGKSECALDLILRGHRFVADDVIHLEKRGEETVLGSGGGLTRHHMEIRGLGIINIRDLFGLSSICDTKKVEMVIQLEMWDPEKEYDRLGLDDRRTMLIGVPFPTLLLPVSPGRNLAAIVEVAIRNHILKGQGVHSARDLVNRQNRQAEGKKAP